MANTHGDGEGISLTDLSWTLTRSRCMRDTYRQRERRMVELGEQVKSTSFPEKESSTRSMSASQLPLSVDNGGLIRVPTVQSQVPCYRAFHDNKLHHSKKRIVRANKQEAQEQSFLFFIHQQQQQHLIQMAQNTGTTHQYWDGVSSSQCHPMSNMDLHSSKTKSEQRQQSLGVDHSMPNGYSFGTASPTSLATASSPATESAFFPAGFAQSLPVGYDASGLSGYLMVKPDPENGASAYLHPAYNLPTLTHGLQQLGHPVDSQVDQFGSWGNSLQDSHLNLGYDAHGLPAMPSIGGCFTPGPGAMAAGSPNIIPYQHDSYSSVGGDGGSDLSFSSIQAATAGTESFPSTADSPDSVTSISSAVLSEGVSRDRESSSYALSSSSRNPFHNGASLAAGSQQHPPAPTIVFSTLPDQQEDGHTAITSFDSSNPVWTQPSPSMATSTDSLPQTMIFASYTGQHDPQGLMPYETQYHGGQQQGDANTATEAPQLLAPRPRRPLPSCAPAIEGSLKRSSKDKRSRGSVSLSRSPSPKSQQPSTAARTITRQRLKKLPKRRPTPLPSSSSSSSAQPRRTSSLSFKVHEPIQAHGTFHQHESHAGMGISLSSAQAQQPLSPTSTATTSSVDTDHGATRRHFNAHVNADSNSTSTNPYAKTSRDRRAAISPVELAERKRKDEYLLWAKDVKGWTYSEIKKAGGFTEAESTLRGRYRMLHKRPEERIRKPKWMGVDIRLLEKGVRLLATNPKSASTSSASSTGKSTSCGSGAQQKKTAGVTSDMATRATNTGRGGSAATCFTGTRHLSPISNSFVSASNSGDTPPTEVEQDIQFQTVSMMPGYHQQGQTFSIPSYPYHKLEPSTTEDDADADPDPDHDDDYLDHEQGGQYQNHQPNPKQQQQPELQGKHKGIAPSSTCRPEGQADLSNPSNVRIPWGKVSEYIATHGGTYRFGNSTCKKKWLALVEDQVGRLGKDINKPFLEDLFRY